jgi:predicted nucleic acid-binding protein
MILADTSAWIEFDRATGSAADQRIATLIAEDGPLAVTEPVVIEVLAGARSDAREDDLRRLLLSFDLLHFESASDFDAAAHIYRRCRRAGITPRGMLDCMIAAVAWRRGAVLLSHDVDFDRVAQVVGLQQDTASLRT